MVSKLIKWNDVLCLDGLMANIGIYLGWGLIQLLKLFCDLGESLVDYAYKFLDFTTWAGLDKVFENNGVKILLPTLLAFALLCLGYTLIINGGEKKPKIIQNVITIIAVIVLIPTAFTYLNDITLAGKDYFLDSNSNSSLSDKVIANGVTDLLYCSTQGLDNYDVDNSTVTGKNGKKVNAFIDNKEGNINYIDVTETIDPTSPQVDEMFNKVLENDTSGYLTASDIKEEKFLWIDMTSYYYRYNINIWAICCALIGFAIAFIFIAIKTVRIIYELVVHQALAFLFSATDLTSGQRAVMVLKSMASSYVVMVITIMLLKVYMLSYQYLVANVSNRLVQGIFILILAFAVIDGPNVVERALGMDAGLSSAWKAVAGIGAGAVLGAKGLVGAGKSVGNLAKVGSKGIAGTSKAIGGIFGKKVGSNKGSSDNGISKTSDSNGNKDKNSNELPTEKQKSAEKKSGIDNPANSSQEKLSTPLSKHGTGNDLEKGVDVSNNLESSESSNHPKSTSDKPLSNTSDSNGNNTTTSSTPNSNSNNTASSTSNSNSNNTALSTPNSNSNNTALSTPNSNSNNTASSTPNSNSNNTASSTPNSVSRKNDKKSNLKSTNAINNINNSKRSLNDTKDVRRKK